MLDTSRLSHAYITEDSFADTLAMAVVCCSGDENKPCRSCKHCEKASRHIHPDIISIGRLDNKLIITVDQIRELKRDVPVIPNDSEKKAYIVRDAGAMNINAQNAFLRILEEPPAHAVFILSTDNPAALLPTVRSRCVELKSMSVGEYIENITNREELDVIIFDFIEALAGDKIKLMECMFRIDKLERLALHDFLSLVRGKVISSLRENPDTGSTETRNKLVHAEEVLIKAGEMLDLNVSSGHIAGFICASLI